MHKIVTGVRTIDYRQGRGELADANPLRTGLTIYNKTNTTLFVLFNGDAQCDEQRFSVILPAESYDTTLYNIPEDQLYKGRISYFLANATSGSINVTEYSRLNRE
jgi:hypothetical protein